MLERVRFGVFDFDLQAREIYKHGRRIRLQDQPLRVLALLVERAGFLVSREEIQQALWPDHTFVDFEHGLNNAIRRLRETLGDSAESPRFIETVPRRGYRFIAPLCSVASVPKTAIRAIAVLPFENLTGDPSQAYFSDGFTDTLISELAQISALRVISRTSAMRYRGSSRSLPDIARELDVQAVVEGSVMRDQERVRITAQLIEASSDRHLWSKAYERDVANILDLQRELAQTIAHELKVQLTSHEAARFSSSQPVSPAAYEAYVKGRYHWNRRTHAGLQRAIELFSKAVQLDDSYAAAHAGLADCYNMLAFWGLLRPSEAYPHAKSAASRAVASDAGLAEAWTALAWPKFTYDWDWKAAASDLQRACELNSGYATAHQWWTHFHAYRSEHCEAEAELKRTLQLDPVSYVMHSNAALIYWMMRKYSDAIECAQAAIELDPSFSPSYYWLGVSLLAVGEREQAVHAFEEAVNHSSQAPVMLAGFAHALAKSGRERESRSVLSRLVQIARDEYVSAYYFAIVHAGLNEWEQSLSALNQAVDERSAWVVKAGVDFRLDELRNDARFKPMLRQIGLPDGRTGSQVSPRPTPKARARSTTP